MFCKNCGKELSAGARFCHECGSAVEAHSYPPVVTQITSNSLVDSISSGALTFGILGIAFSMTLWFSFLGIIFSGIALGKAKKYHYIVGESNGKVTAGRILGIIGLVSGILYTVFAIVYVLYLLVIFSSMFGMSAYA